MDASSSSSLSAAESTSSAIYALLEHTFITKLQKLEEQRDKAIIAANRLVPLHPEIPFTGVAPWSFLIMSYMVPIEKGVFISRMRGDLLLLAVPQYHPHSGDALLTFNVAEKQQYRLPTGTQTHGERHFEGKRVYLDTFEEKEITHYTETGDYIMLPPAPGTHPCDFLYRDINSVVKRLHWVNKSEKGLIMREVIYHFADTPWKVTSYEAKGYTNVFFRNLHTGEVRRYYLYQPAMFYFMLKNEIFYITYQDNNGMSDIVRCSGREHVRSISSVAACVTLKSYVVLLSQHCTMSQDILHYIYTENYPVTPVVTPSTQ